MNQFSKSDLSFLITFFIVFLFLVVSTVYYFAFKDTGTSYSFTQRYQEYFSLTDWNLDTHAVADIDQDGSKDMITFTHCVFLSSLQKTHDKDADLVIPKSAQCQEPGMSQLVLGENPSTVGQKIKSRNPFWYNFLEKSYLVKTSDNKWKMYQINGFQLRTYVLSDLHLFLEVSPTLLDRIDVLTYQIGHVGVVLLLLFLLHIVDVLRSIS